jgi:hypothetical protein
VATLEHSRAGHDDARLILVDTFNFSLCVWGVVQIERIKSSFSNGFSHHIYVALEDFFELLK